MKAKDRVSLARWNATPKYGLAQITLKHCIGLNTKERIKKRLYSGVSIDPKVALSKFSKLHLKIHNHPNSCTMSNTNNSSLKSIFFTSSQNQQQRDIAPSAESSNVQQDLLQVKTNARHCEEMKIYFLDHYLEFLTYLDARKKRTVAVKERISQVWIELGESVEKTRLFTSRSSWQ